MQNKKPQKIQEYEFQRNLADYQLFLGGVIAALLTFMFKQDWNNSLLVLLAGLVLNEIFERRFTEYEKNLKKK